MVIVKIIGGLGNQLFCFALCEKLLSLGKEVKIEKKYYDIEDMSIGLKFSSIGNKYKVASDKEINRYASVGHSYSSRLMRYVHRIMGTQIKEKEPYRFDDKILEVDNVYIEGYWQTEKYFSDIRSNILEVFSFPEFVDRDNIEAALKIKNENAVSVHVRRGDYIGKHKKRFGGIADEKYLKCAINYIGENVKNPVYYVFSNDFMWTKKFFKGSNYRFVDWNQNPADDMHLMTLCKHNIVANSSFSWWGAWLNKNSSKIVVAPQKWVNDYPAPDIVPADWIRI